MAQIISGKILAQEIKQEVAKTVKELQLKKISVKLAVVLAGDNPASQVYVKGKAKDCEECGILSDIIRLPETVSEKELIDIVKKLNDDHSVNGILVQLPLPKHINNKAVIEAICPIKDVDGFTAQNAGNMLIGQDCYLPCTPSACLQMIKSTGTDIKGKDVVVVGRSNIVGKPASILLLQENATVTVTHSYTVNLKEKCLAADIIIAAVGIAGFITGDMVKEGAIIIDVGINKKVDGKLCGDVAFDDAEKKAAFITPVPGGVGLMTRAVLMQNTVKAAQKQSGK